MYLTVFTVVFLSFGPPALAAFQKGTASVDLHWVKVSTSPSFTFTYNNPAGSDAALCIRIDRPSNNFTLTGGSSSGWSESHTASRIDFTGGSIPAGGSGSFVVTSTASTSSAQSAWSVWGSKNANCNPSTKADASSAGALNTGIDGSAPTNNGIGSVTANSSAQATVVANAASDSGGGLHATPYYFEETTGTGHNSGWQAGTTFIDSSLSPNTTYSYHLMVRDVFDNQSGWSGTSSATTSANTPSGGSFSSVGLNSITVNWSSNSNPSGTQYYVENTTNSTNSGWITATSWNSTGLAGNNTYTYRVKARNSAQSETGWYNVGSQSTLTPTATPTPPTPTPVPTETASPTPIPPPPVPGAIPVEPVPEPVGPGPSAPTVAPELPAGDIGAPDTTTADLSISGSTASLRAIKPTPGDIWGPRIVITQSPEKIIKEGSFHLTARAIDDQGEIHGVIEYLGYSLDDGLTWHPVSSVNGLGTQTASFEINSYPLLDGNYKILLRASDNSENKSNADGGEIVIDQENPRIISLSARSGALELASETAGDIRLSSGLQFELHGMFTGGVAKGFLEVAGEKFNFEEGSMNEFWNSKIKTPDKIGIFPVNITLEDGAGNKIEEKIFDFSIADPVVLTSQNTKNNITVFEFNNLTDEWQKFNAETYRKQNPLNTQSIQNEGLVLPEGKYYFDLGRKLMGIKIPEYSQILILSEVSALSGNLSNVEPAQDNATKSDAVTQGIRTIKTLEGRTVSELRSNDVIIFNFNPKNYINLEQVAIYSEIAKDKSKKVEVIAVVQDIYKDLAKALFERGNYQIQTFVDTQGLVQKDLFKYHSPTSIFIDRRGDTKSIRSGFLSEDKVNIILNRS